MSVGLIYMRTSRFLRDGELALTHLSTPFRSKPRTFHHPLPNSAISRTNHTCTLFRMSSDSNSPKWTSQKVRNTFLDYFKENGHTFGMYKYPSPSLRRGAFGKEKGKKKKKKRNRYHQVLTWLNYSPVFSSCSSL